jgi:hypothetical protein
MIYWEGRRGKAISLDDAKEKENPRKRSQDQRESNESQVFDLLSHNLRDDLRD